MNRSAKAVVIAVVILVLLAAGAWVAWKYWPRLAPQPPVASQPAGDALVVINGAPASAQAEKPKPPASAPGDAELEPILDEIVSYRPPQPAKLSAEQAAEALAKGNEALRAGKTLEARTLLNRAYWSGRLSDEQADAIRPTLETLAEKTLIGRGSAVFADDPYTVQYVARLGQTLAKIEGRGGLWLHVPTQLLTRVNNLQRPEDIQAEVAYKMIRGPFHAIIYKKRFLMDVYLQREGLERVFIRRFRVGTGSNGSTPEGLWRVRLGGKSAQAPWYGPDGVVYYGQPGYAFGSKGLWIPLEGLDEHNRMLTSYGIHSTDDPSSIGKASSRGCIRLSDEDIELVYSLLYEHWSTVQVLP